MAPALQMALVAQGLMHSQALYVIAKLGIASRLANGSCSVTDLAEATLTSEDSLRRLLRTMASFGLFHEESHNVYALTPLGATLDANTPGWDAPRSFLLTVTVDLETYEHDPLGCLSCPT